MLLFFSIFVEYKMRFGNLLKASFQDCTQLSLYLYNLEFNDIYTMNLQIINAQSQQAQQILLKRTYYPLLLPHLITTICLFLSNLFRLINLRFFQAVSAIKPFYGKIFQLSFFNSVVNKPKKIKGFNSKDLNNTLKRININQLYLHPVNRSFNRSAWVKAP